MPLVTIYVYKVNVGDRGSCPVCEAWDGHESRDRQNLPAIPNPACLSGQDSCFCEVETIQRQEEESGGGGGPRVDEDPQPDGGGGVIGSDHFPDFPDGGGGWGGSGGGGEGWGDPTLRWDPTYGSWGDGKPIGG